MRSVVGALLLLLLTSCDVAEPPTLPPVTITVSETVEVDDTPVLDAGGIGKVRLGMTPAELQATGEIGGEANEPEFSCVAHTLNAVRGWVGIMDGVAVELRIEAGVRTPDGLRIGDSRARMHRLYPEAEQDPHGFNQPLDASARYRFYFMNAGDTVTGIELSRPDRRCLS
ncbi:hypothetical protein ACRAKI_00470 [Saccharothrix isguenensis]